MVYKHYRKDLKKHRERALGEHSSSEGKKKRKKKKEVRTRTDMYIGSKSSI